MKDVMIDLETLGTRYNAVIISIGAVYFDRYTGEIGSGFSINVQPGVNRDSLTVDYDTIKWWFEQSDSARKMSMENPAPLKEAMQRLAEFLAPGITLWSHSTFDIPILTYSFDLVNIAHPVPFRNMRDIRTLMDLADHKSETQREGTHHYALHDAIFQAKYVSEAMYKLKYGDR